MKFARIIVVIMLSVSTLMAGCKKEDPSPEVVDDHEYVDLGLPSGNLWAKCNIGATSPEDAGCYFAWGETSTKKMYDWKQYKFTVFVNGVYLLNKYCTDPSCGVNGFADHITELKPEDDAAVVHWGNGWHMPDYDDFDELYLNTTHEWISINGVCGRRLIGSNGNSIFLPTTGFYLDDTIICKNLGIYWSTTLQTTWQTAAWSLHFDDTNCHVCGSYDRDRGQVIRPVRNGQHRKPND